MTPNQLARTGQWLESETLTPGEGNGRDFSGIIRLTT